MSRPLECYAGMSVLVVDDNPADVAFLQQLLIRRGLERVYTETDSRKVHRLLAKHKPDLVLLALRMPHVDGFAVLGPDPEVRGRRLPAGDGSHRGHHHGLSQPGPGRGRAGLPDQTDRRHRGDPEDRQPAADPPTLRKPALPHRRSNSGGRRARRGPGPYPRGSCRTRPSPTSSNPSKT